MDIRTEKLRTEPGGLQPWLKIASLSNIRPNTNIIHYNAMPTGLGSGGDGNSNTYLSNYLLKSLVL